MFPIKFILALFCALAMTGSAFTTVAPSQSRRASSLSVSPTDFTDVSSIVLAKCDVHTMGLGVAFKKMEVGAKILNPDVGAQFLSDGSHALMDFPSVFGGKMKLSKLQIRYAQVVGRLMILGIGLLPHHGFAPEELGVQLFLLGVSMKPVIRSLQLYRCISSTRCLEECELELEELEESLS